MTVRQKDTWNSTGGTDAYLLGAAALLKGIGGWMGGSHALLVDSLNSVSDAVRSTRFGKLQASLVGMLFAVLILVGAIEAVLSGIGQLLHSSQRTPNEWAAVAFFFAVVVSQVLFIIRYRQLEQEDREKARRYTKEHRLSMYASVFVAAGMVLWVVGKSFDIPELLYADPAASLLVALIAIIKALRLMLLIFGGSPTLSKQRAEDPTPFLETVQRVRGVIEVRELRATKVAEAVKIDLILSVNPRMTVKEAEEVAQRSRDLLVHRFVQVVEVDVRVEPYHSGYPYKSNDDLLNGDSPTIVQ
ncbi:cation diffusion facilitator family transporter [Saccharibacillus kuerlensis]|nr:cation transporter [Saccharibacillus kuerlensis]